MAKSYMRISLDNLTVVRDTVRNDLKELSAKTGKSYSIRTFYLGPRDKFRCYIPMTTLKADAYAAKVAIYENSKLKTYV